MEIITATRPRECTACKEETKLIEINFANKLVVVKTICVKCQIVFVSLFRL